MNKHAKDMKELSALLSDLGISDSKIKVDRIVFSSHGN
jgi:hypothetical protein